MSIEKTRGTWQMLIAMLLSGTIGWFVLFSGQDVQDVVFYRCLFGGIALLGLLTIQRRWVLMTGKQMLYLGLGGITLILNWLCLFSAYRYSSISLATVIYHLQPFFLLLLTALIKREPFSLAHLLWLIVAFMGVALVSGLNSTALQSSLFIGVALASLAALLYAITTLATRQLKGVPSGQIAGLQMLIGLIILAPLSHTSLTTFNNQTWFALLTLGLVHTGLMYTLMYSAFQRLSTLSIATLSFVYPLVAIMIDVSVLGVTLTVIQIIGMGLILLAVMANQMGWKFSKKHSYIFEPDTKSKPTWVSWR